MSVVIRLKVPIEMQYTVIPMGTSKVNSSLTKVIRTSVLIRTSAVAYACLVI